MQWLFPKANTLSKVEIEIEQNFWSVNWLQTARKFNNMDIVYLLSDLLFHYYMYLSSLHYIHTNRCERRCIQCQSLCLIWYASQGATKQWIEPRHKSLVHFISLIELRQFQNSISFKFTAAYLN